MPYHISIKKYLVNITRIMDPPWFLFCILIFFLFLNCFGAVVIITKHPSFLSFYCSEFFFGVCLSHAALLTMLNTAIVDVNLKTKYIINAFGIRIIKHKHTNMILCMGKEDILC